MSDIIELRARALAAKKMNSADSYGSRLPDELWRQALPEAMHAYRIELLQKFRSSFAGHVKNGTSPASWELEMWVRQVDDFKQFESEADRDLRLGHANALEMSEEELDRLDVLYPGAKARTADRRERLAREAACPGHEFESTAPPGHDHSRGWHPGRCKHCGIDMSVDSGD